MKDHDQVCRFTIDNTAIRGQLVSLDASWQACLEHCTADAFGRRLLGEALSAVALLASTLKMKGTITLQIRGQGAIHLLVAQATSERSIRGLVRQTRPIDDKTASLSDIFDADKIVITIDQGQGEPYQGIVPLTGFSLQQALEAYFEHSEQLPTRLWLAADRESASGMLLQKLPQEYEDITDDSWNRVSQLAATITAEELIRLSEKEILFRLFHEESVRLFDGEPMRFSCSCSRDRTAGMIKSLGQQEAYSILQEQRRISVTCGFCDAHYDFDPIDVEQLFLPVAEYPASRSLH
jgi:molecular chaperone Hsp33